MSKAEKIAEVKWQPLPADKYDSVGKYLNRYGSSFGSFIGRYSKILAGFFYLCALIFVGKYIVYDLLISGRRSLAAFLISIICTGFPCYIATRTLLIGSKIKNIVDTQQKAFVNGTIVCAAGVVLGKTHLSKDQGLRAVVREWKYHSYFIDIEVDIENASPLHVQLTIPEETYMAFSAGDKITLCCPDNHHDESMMFIV